MPQETPEERDVTSRGLDLPPRKRRFENRGLDRETVETSGRARND